MHNIKQSLKPPFGAFILSDYYSFIKEDSTHNLFFAGSDGSSRNEECMFIKIGEPGRQLIEARNKFGVVDVTYPPNVGKDTSELFNFIVTNFSEDDRSNAILCIKFKSEKSINLLKEDKLFGKYFKTIFENIGVRNRELMETELTVCRTLGEINRTDTSPDLDISLRLEAKALSVNPRGKQ